MNAREYYLEIQATVHTAPHVVQSSVQFDEIDVNECYIRGVLSLVGNLELHIAEYVVTTPHVRRLKYRYHLQTAEGKLISRWDNVPHHPQIPTFPDHRHDEAGGVHASPSVGLADVLVATLHLTE